MPRKRLVTKKPKLLTLATAGIFFIALLLQSAPLESNDAFVTVSMAEPAHLLPLFASDSASYAVSRLIFNGLVKYDKDLRLIGDLAERWEVLKEGMVIVFHLRKDVRWHDGTPFTARDVEFTFQKLIDPNTPSPYGGDFEKVRSVRALDSHTVEVVYKEPFSPGLASWSMGMLPRHLLEDEDLLKTEFSRKPVGTGPYILKKWVTGDRIELWANPAYFEGRPFLDRYIVRIIPDQATTFLELQTENLDQAPLTPLEFQRQTDNPFFQANYRKFATPSFGYTYIGYNLKHPLFLDRRVRNAIGMAISKKEIIAVTLLGRGRVATGPFLPGTWAYNEEVEETVYDPLRARALLAEAGWSDSDEDGILDRSGERFSFTLLTHQGNDQRKMACEIIQRQLGEIGIEVKIRTLEWGTFLKEFIDKKRFEAVLLGWQLSPEPDIHDLFHSSKTKPGEFNFVSYENPEVDRLLEEGRRLFSEGQRAVVYRKLHAILSREEPYTFLYVPEALLAVHRRFRGVELSPLGIGHNFIHWTVQAGEEKYKFPKGRNL